VTFLSPAAAGSSPAYQVVSTAQLTTNYYYGQPHATWSSADDAFVIPYENSNPGYWVISVAKYHPNGTPAKGNGSTVTTDVANDTFYEPHRDEGWTGVVGDLYATTFISSKNSNLSMVSFYDGTGAAVGSPVTIATSEDYWQSIVGTSQGFIHLLENGAGANITYLPTATDGGPSIPADGGLAVTTFSNVATIVNASPVFDSGGLGGVGVGLLYEHALSFAYVNANGIVAVQPAQVFSHDYNYGDQYGISASAGTFMMSLYDVNAHATNVFVSTCQQ
jgi:hypothetical protein